MGPCPFMVWLRRVVVVVALQGAAVCQASVVVTGDVSPDPTTTTLFDNLYIGFTGHGTLTIDDGSTVQSANGYLGYWSDSTGHVTVDGVGSTWINNTELFLGGFGDGTLVVTGGGAVGSTLGFIGVGSTGRVTVDGHGSSWTNTWDLLVGDGAGGEGTLEITSGGEVSNSGEGFVAYGPDSIGVVTIDGVGSTWTNDGAVFIGRRGDGTLEITGGGKLSNREAQ
ncbi:MAG: hypothetical protein KF708_05660 [Pirellulales bacterium]|nr:hypothetical protein [Pirellulales bacterium]